MAFNEPHQSLNVNAQPYSAHPNQPNQYQPEISGNNNNVSSLIAYINSLNSQLQIMNKNINDLQKQHQIDIQRIYQSMSSQIKILTNKIQQNQQKNDKIIYDLQQNNYKLQQQINTLTQPQNIQIPNEQKTDNNKHEMEVKLWLTNKCKLHQYYSLFIQNGYNNLLTISTITTNHLQNIGIDNNTHLKKICKEIKLLNPSAKQTKIIDTTNDDNTANLAKQKQSKKKPKKDRKENTKRTTKKTAGARWEKVKTDKGKAASNMYEVTESKPLTPKRKINWGKNKKRFNKFFDNFPASIQNGCKDAGIDTFNPLQSKVMNSLCERQRDNMILSSAGSGKTVAIVLSAIYRLLQTGEGAAHVVFIAVDTIHVLLIKQLCDTILKYYDGIKVVEQIRGSKYNPDITGKGKNIFLCSPGKAINIFEKNGKAMVKNSIAICIFDGDQLMVEPLFSKKIQNMFQFVPDSADIDINIVSNSCCGEMAMNVQMCLGDERYGSLCKFEEYSYDNLEFWSAFCSKNKRNGKVMDLLGANVFGCGLIFCSNQYCGKNVVGMVGEKYKCVLLDCKGVSDGEDMIKAYNSGIVQYLVVINYSPCVLLKGIDVDKLRFLLHYEIKAASKYLMRCAVGRYGGKDKKIYCVSLMDEQSTKIYEDVERMCSIKLRQLPKKMSKIFREEDVDGKGGDESYDHGVEYDGSYDNYQGYTVGDKVQSNDVRYDVSYNNQQGYNNNQQGYNNNQQEYGNKFYGDANNMNYNMTYNYNNNNYGGRMGYNNNNNYGGQQQMWVNKEGGGEQMIDNNNINNVSVNKVNVNEVNVNEVNVNEVNVNKVNVIKVNDKPKDVKIELIECINNYMKTGIMDGIMNLNCRDFKIWALIINHWFRDRTESEIPYLIDLIVNLFRNKILNNKDDRFNDVIIKYLSIEIDSSSKVNAKFIDYVGYLFAHLCYNMYLIPNQCYTFFNKRYKEYSDENKEQIKININKVIKASANELQRIQAPQKLINKINKLAVK